MGCSKQVRDSHQAISQEPAYAYDPYLKFGQDTTATYPPRLNPNARACALEMERRTMLSLSCSLTARLHVGGHRVGVV